MDELSHTSTSSESMETPAETPEVEAPAEAVVETAVEAEAAVVEAAAPVAAEADAPSDAEAPSAEPTVAEAPAAERPAAEGPVEKAAPEGREGEEIPSMDSVFAYALVHLPQVRSAAYGIEAQERLLAMQRGGRSPRLYARGSLYTNYSDGLANPVDPNENYPITDQLNNNQFKQIAMGINVPIFNRWQVQTSINKAKIGLQDANYLYDNTILEVQKRVQEYHTEALAALDSYHSAQEAVSNGEQVFQFAEERFNVGTGTALEMQEARKQLYEATSDMISSRYVLIFYTKILDFYMGKPLGF